MSGHCPGVDDDEVDRLLREALEPVKEYIEIEHMLGWAGLCRPLTRRCFCYRVRDRWRSGLSRVADAFAAGGSGLPTVPEHFRSARVWVSAARPQLDLREVSFADSWA